MTRALLVLVACSLAAGRALGHQVPSPDANNRYLKATLLPDRVRVVWTLLVGERPGAAERRRMDTDGDGRLGAEEMAAYGAEVAKRMAPAVTLDGKAVASWRVAGVGVGEATVEGGTFAVDLVLDARYGDAGAEEHRLAMDDAAAVPLAGDVEVRVEESPGVRVKESHLATERAGIELNYAFTGNARGPGERAVAVVFAVDAAVRPSGGGRRWMWMGVVAGVVGLAVAGWAWARRRARGITGA